jgi:hypothetical protein
VARIHGSLTLTWASAGRQGNEAGQRQREKMSVHGFFI